MPRSQRTHNTTKIVQSIGVPISQEIAADRACAAPRVRFSDLYGISNGERIQKFRLFT